MYMNYTNSTYQNIICGVSQGPILGPILFSLYFMTCKVSTGITRIIFADDTNLTICINENNIETPLYYRMYSQLGWNDHRRRSKIKWLMMYPL